MNTRSYRFLERLGVGGFGEVYRVELLDGEGFRKLVAVKLLRTDGPAGAHQAQLERLRDEARVLGLLRHSALVGVDGLVRLRDPAGAPRWGMVLELVDGPPLDGLVETVGPLPDAVVLHIGREVAGALDTAYHAVIDGRPLGLVHRDVKPGNVHLAPDGRVKLLDFGIATAAFTGREAATRVGGILGTPQYMAPERTIGDDGPESDVFAIGATLAALLTGRDPAPAALGRAAHEERLSELLEGVSPAWRDRLTPLLAYLPGDRPAAGEVEASFARALAADRGDLRAWCAEHVPSTEGETAGLTGSTLQTVEAPSAHVGREVSPRAGWRPMLAIVVVVLLLAVAVGSAGILAFGSAAVVVGTVGGPISSAGCATSIEEVLDALVQRDDPGAPHAVRATKNLLRGCYSGEAGLVASASFETRLDTLLADGELSVSDGEILEELSSTWVTPNEPDSQP